MSTTDHVIAFLMYSNWRLLLKIVNTCLLANLCSHFGLQVLKPQLVVPYSSPIFTFTFSKTLKTYFSLSLFFFLFHSRSTLRISSVVLRSGVMLLHNAVSHMSQCEHYSLLMNTITSHVSVNLCLWLTSGHGSGPMDSIIISFFCCQSVSLLFSLSCLHVSTFGRVTSMVCTCTMNGCRTNRRCFLRPGWATSDNSHGLWIVNPTLSTGQPASHGPALDLHLYHPGYKRPNIGRVCVR